MHVGNTGCVVVGTAITGASVVGEATGESVVGEATGDVVIGLPAGDFVAHISQLD